MSVYISGMARRAGAARGSRGSSNSNRGGAAEAAGGRREDTCKVGLVERLPGGPGDSTSGDRGIAEDQRVEKEESTGRSVHGTGWSSAVAGGAGGGLGGGVCRGVCMSVQELSYCLCLPCCCTVLLQHGADPNIRNTDGKSALDLAEPSAKAVLTGQSHTNKHTNTCCVTLSSCSVCSFFVFLNISSIENLFSPTLAIYLLGKDLKCMWPELV